MTSVNFQQWIQHPETLNRDTLYELRNLLARYPYFQSLRLLYLKNLYILHDISFGGELRKAVLYIADRRQLFRLIEGDRYDVQARKKGVPLTEVLKTNLRRPHISIDRRFLVHSTRRGDCPHQLRLFDGLHLLSFGGDSGHGTAGRRNAQTQRLRTD